MSFQSLFHEINIRSGAGAQPALPHQNKGSFARTSLPAVAAVAATSAVSHGFASGLDNAIAEISIHVGGAKAGRLLTAKMIAKRDRFVIVP
jgi:hypothetical protein